MTTLVIGPTTLRDTDDGRVRASSVIAGLDEPLELWVDLHPSLRDAVPDRADPWLPATALLASRLGATVRAESPVTAPLVRSARGVTQLLSEWFPAEMSRVDVSATTAGRVAPWRRHPGSSAMCFTGGVDSFYSLLRAQDSPDYLVNVSGLDVTSRWPEIEKATRLRLLRVATDFDARLVTLRSNVRTVMLDHGLRWGDHAHGSVLAGFGHLLSGRLGTFMIPATHSKASVQPWGSHPRLDPQWSSDALRVVHHGFEASRVDKTAAIARDPRAVDSLRVCLRHNSDENCGECSKCLRTMATLAFLGELDSTNRFPTDLTPSLFEPITVSKQQDLNHLIAARDLGLRTQRRPDIVEALDGVIARSEAQIHAASP
ncbi:hypothetical protein [Demequina activiva]|uniref:hypothetical protein n=1 Tax=Demequina activiva TaxID=1582364 RepID=UPI0019455E66|nr:hypothetical protein [Demequina activiva]